MARSLLLLNGYVTFCRGDFLLSLKKWQFLVIIRKIATGGPDSVPFWLSSARK